MAPQLSPAQAWAALKDGNARFLSGQQRSNDIPARLSDLTIAQAPNAVIFGCSDSRVSAEIILDQRLGEVFVIRTAGHVVDTTVVGSIEYAIEYLQVPLVVVLGHDHCGAVGAAEDALATGEYPTGFVRTIVDRIIPSIVSAPGMRAALAGESPFPSNEAIGMAHVGHTVQMLGGISAVLREAVQQGRCAIVGAEYQLADGKVSWTDKIGLPGEQ